MRTRGAWGLTDCRVFIAGTTMVPDTIIAAMSTLASVA
jgi:hypothetical protein